MAPPEWKGDVSWRLDPDVLSFLHSVGTSVLQSVPVQVRPNGVTKKGATDAVTRLDIRLDELVREHAWTRLGMVNYLSEESGITEKMSSLWIVCDPLDGTKFFAYSYPAHSPLTVAVLALEEQYVLGALVVDLHGRCYYISENVTAPLLARFSQVGNSFVGEVQPPCVTDSRRLSLDEIVVSLYLPNLERWNLAHRVLAHADFVVSPRNHLALLSAGGRIGIVLEPKDVPLFEHIGQILATLRGARVRQADGRRLSMVPTCNQRSIATASDELLEHGLALLAHNCGFTSHDACKAAPLPTGRRLLDTPQQETCCHTSPVVNLSAGLEMNKTPGAANGRPSRGATT